MGNCRCFFLWCRSSVICIMPDGSEHPIVFISRTLSQSENNHSQIEKEALALVFGVNKFHQYIYIWKFFLITDHKRLTAILCQKKGIPSLAAARMQRWSLLFSAYQHEIFFKPTDKHCNADGVSRLPIGEISFVNSMCN